MQTPSLPAWLDLVPTLWWWRGQNQRRGGGASSPTFASCPSLAAGYSPHRAGVWESQCAMDTSPRIQAARTVTCDSAVPSSSRGCKDVLHLGRHKLVNKMFTTVCKERLLGWLGLCGQEGQGSGGWTLAPGRYRSQQREVGTRAFGVSATTSEPPCCRDPGWG